MNKDDFNKTEERIIRLFSKELNIFGEKRYGKIDGVDKSFIARNFSEYMFAVTYQYEKYLIKSSGWDVPDVAVPQLTESAEIFCYFTIGGIMKSELWKREISQHLSHKKDWFLAGICLLNTMGYGKYSVYDYIETPDAVSIYVDLKYSTEAELYLKWYGSSEYPKCYFSCGVLLALTNLIYNVKIMDDPDLSVELFEECRDNGDFKFTCNEKTCVVQDDKNDTCNFEVIVL